VSAIDPEQLTAPVTVRYTSDIREMRRALAAIGAELPVIRWLRRLGYAALVGGALVMVVRGFTGGFLIVMVGGAVLLWIFLMSWSNAWMATRGNSALAGEQTIRFQDDGVYGSSGGLTGHFAWAVFTRFMETPEFLLLFQGNRCAAFIPWRALRDDTDRARLRLLVRRHTGTDVGPAAPPPPPEGGIVVRYRLRTDDVAGSLTAMAYRTRSGLRSSLTLLVMMGALAWLQRGAWRRPADDLFATLSAAVPVFMMLLFSPLGYRYFARRYLRRLGSGEAEARVTEAGVLSWNTRGSTLIEWSRVREALETRALFVFTIAATQGVFVPKRVLADDQVSEIRAMARERMPRDRRRGMLR
jgi:hypothetical protein